MRLIPCCFPVMGGRQLFALLCAMMLGTYSLNAATITVSSTADSGAGSLRAAIAAAGNGDTIQFDAALNGQSIMLTSGELAIDKDITIDGPGANQLSVKKSSGSPDFRIFHILLGHSFILRGLTIDGNGTRGAGVWNDYASVTIDGCVVQGCFRDGGIRCYASFNDDSYLTVVDSIIRHNQADTAGGGIYNEACCMANLAHALVSIRGSVITENIAGNCPSGFSCTASGGGIFNSGEMDITNSIVSGNVSGFNGPGFPFGNGGGISNQPLAGSLFITNCTISGNSTGLFGGGVYNSAFLLLTSSTLSGNAANGTHDGEGWGEGAALYNANTTTITNSTLTNNNATHSGGAVSNRGPLTIRHSTLSGNNGFKGTSIANYSSGTVHIGHTALKASSGITPSITNISGTVTSDGYNLISDNGGGFFTAPGDQIDTEPMLGPLQDNGGPTFTHEPLTGSPAIDAGNPNFTPPPANDQRGPLYQRVFNGRIDVGSVEVQPAPPTPTPTATVPTSTPTPTPFFVRLLWEGFDAVSTPALPPDWLSSSTSGPANCTPTGTCALGTQWVTRTGPSETAPNAAFHDDPSCVTDSNLNTPPLFIPVTQFPVVMSFWHDYDLEEGHDGGVVEISIDGGPFSDINAAGGNADYNGTISMGSLSPIAGRQAWTGSSGGFVNSLVSLPIAAGGHNVVLRFRLATDCSGGGVGWYVDSISIAYYVSDASPTPPPPTPTATATASSSPTPTPTATTTPSPSPARALNISTRLLVLADDNVGIGGFIITGSAKQVLLRGIGPSLAQFGVPNPLVDPVMELHGPNGFITITNDNWRDTQEVEIMATGLAPANDLESAILVTLDPGAYTAIVKGNNATSGVGLVEVYGLGPSDSQLANISTRGFVSTGANVMIGGFILGGADHAHIFIHAGGPPGINPALADAVLELRDGSGTLLASNDNCESPIIGPPNPADACIDISLQAGPYTAILAGKEGGTGIGLVEIYNLQ